MINLIEVGFGDFDRNGDSSFHSFVFGKKEVNIWITNIEDITDYS